MVKDLPLSEITLRKYEKPYRAEKRELVKKFCLSLGLLQPGDSRDIIVDILFVLLKARQEKKKLSSEEIKAKVEEVRKRYSLEMKGLAESNIRRQLKRLRDLMLIEKRENLYYIAEFDKLASIVENRIEKFIVEQTLRRIEEYAEAVDACFAEALASESEKQE